MSKIEDFKKEFKELLEKYNITISACVGECSDTYGINDEHMIVYIDRGGDKDTEFRVDGWGIDSSDIDIP